KIGDSIHSKSLRLDLSLSLSSFTKPTPTKGLQLSLQINMKGIVVSFLRLLTLRDNKSSIEFSQLVTQSSTASRCASRILLTISFMHPPSNRSTWQPIKKQLLLVFFHITLTLYVGSCL